MKYPHLLFAAIVVPFAAYGQSQTLQSVTTAGSNTTNPIILNTTATASASNTVAPALTLSTDCIRTGPASVIADFKATGSIAGTYTNITPTTVTGSGSGLTVSISVASTLVGTVTVVSAGSGYRVNDVVSIPVTSVGGKTSSVLYMYISNVTGTNLYNYTSAPLTATSITQGAGMAGSYTPVMQFSPRYRNGQPVSNSFSFGQTWQSNEKGIWGFKIDTSYVFGLDSANVNIASIRTPKASLNQLLSTEVTSNGTVTVNGQINTSFYDVSTKYLGNTPSTGAAFTSAQLAAPSPVASVTLSTAGSDYNPGTYYAVPATGGKGTGLLLDIVTGTDGKVFTATISTTSPSSASGYSDGDVISATIPGGTGFSATIVTGKGNDNFSALTNISTFQSSTADSFFTVRSTPQFDQSATATGNLYGFFHNPDVTALKGKNIAFQNITGDTYFCTGSGNVGIGTIAPAQKLSVNGTILAQKILVTELSTAWPDYVFTPGFKRSSPEQIAAYIKENKHLPDVPSAAAIAADNADIGDTQAILLKKIEELTLLIIEQHKTLARQSQRLQQLEAAESGN